MNRILLGITIVLSVVAIFIGSDKEVTTFFNEPTQKIKVLDDDQTITNLKLEEYIIGVVAAEMPASFNTEALKAQAIASRTYAMYKINKNNLDYDVVSNISDQSYITIDEMKNKWQDEYEKYYNIVKNAVMSTEGMVMKYKGKIIESYYFAMSNGYTEEASLVFSESKEYLVSVPSEYDNETLNNFKKTVSFSKDDFCNKLGIECSEIKIDSIERSVTHRINTITINQKSFKGTEVRKLLGLRSTDFEIMINDTIDITTYGYGHGVGMSQYGANGMAHEGKNYEEILKHYYKDIEICKI